MILNRLRRAFANRQVVILSLLLAAILLFVILLGGILGPVLAALVLAYLLEGIVRAAVRAGLPRPWSVIIVFTLFVLAAVALVFGLAPLLYRQLTQLLQQVPVMFGHGQELLMQLPARYPALFTEPQVVEIIARIRAEVAGLGQALLSQSVASVVGLITFLVYLILVPLLVFFFLKDKELIQHWLQGYLPRDRGLARRVWRDVDRQIGNYIRGKFWEILVVWLATYAAFHVLELQFAMLLGLLVGLSVIIPYVGATVVTLPILAVGLYQFGWTSDLATLAIVYGVIQALDGNVLVPLLFSEVVDLHPIAIIVAILFFGGIWGFWGVFFAIPLATVVQAVMKAWPDEDAAQDVPAGVADQSSSAA